MFPKALRALVWGLLSLLATAASAGDPWQGSRIMPKSDQLVLRVGPQYTADVYAIEWPATVERIEGQWLWIADHSGYRVPPVAGWVSKDEVLNVAAAHDYYMELLQTTDAPWVHWLVGICLENSRETEAAREEYAACLNVSPSDGTAVQMAVASSPNLLDAAVRLQRLQAATSAEEATAAAELLQKLWQTAPWDGVRRPYVCFEQAEALRKAFRSKLSEERKAIHGIDAKVAMANSERGGGATEAGELFKKADDAYKCSASAASSIACVGPHCWKGYMGRAELYLNRIAVLEDEAWSLIAAGANAPAPTGAKLPAVNRPAEQIDAATTPPDLTILDAFLSQWKSPPPTAQQKSALTEQTDAVCVCLAEEIRCLHAAVASFDAAVSRSPNHIEAYRDRGLAYLALARCEATLAAIEEADPDEQPRLASLYPDLQLSPQKLDRALVDGRRHFNDVLDKLPAAQAKEAEIAAEKKDLAKAVELITAGYVAAGSKRGGDAREPNKGQAASPPKPILLGMQEKLSQLRIDAAKAAGQLDRDERQAKEELSQADAAFDQSYAILSKSANLGHARRSAQTAVDKANFADTESLKILAAIFAAQCNFDRAEFYQKMATTYASDDERRQILKTLNEYRHMGELVVAKAKAKTASSPPAQGKGAKSADSGQADDAGSAGD